jgi:hypothetical protein
MRWRAMTFLANAGLAVAACGGGGSNAESDAGPAADAAASDATSPAPDAASPLDAAVPTDGGAMADGPHDAGAGQDGPSGEAATGPVTPAPAMGAGFTHLVFEDDFTTNDTIAPTQNAASGYKWYWSFDIHGAPVPWSLDTSASAATTSDAGPGDNASPAGGILTVFGPGDPNDALVTVPGWALNNASATLPPEGQGNWAHAYFEAYIDTPLDETDGSVSGGWPAFWSWSVQGLKNFGFGGSSLTTAAYSEIDFFETYGTIFGQTPGNWTATMHQWPANASSDGHNQHMSGGWHTYGCLWTSTDAGSGEVKFYFDGTQVDGTVPTGTGQTQFSLEGLSQFLVLGSGKNWKMNVDWVRVWQ